MGQENEEEIAVEGTYAGPDDDSLIDPLKTGFKWYIPSKQVVESTEHDRWTISGDDMQVLTMTVPPGGKLSTEIGTFMFMDPSMSSGVECCNGGCSRWCGGESCRGTAQGA